ncbi:MAG: hypothetical protein IMX00_11410, partial [Limnochordales bacterium]|nr:hypothetical protein [Limnochordales bacterium]
MSLRAVTGDVEPQVSHVVVGRSGGSGQAWRSESAPARRSTGRIRETGGESAVADGTEEAARRHIERIARARREGSDELKDALARAIEHVTMMFPQTGHFLM